MIYELGDNQITTKDDDFWIADNAILIGQISLGHRVSVWYNVVIRADNDYVTIGDDTNIQDGSILHVDNKKPLKIGRGCTIGHKVMLHGCEIGDYSMIGINATVLNGAKIGSYCLIGAGSLVTEGVEIPDGSMVMGLPGRVKRSLNDMEKRDIESAAANYTSNIELFRNSLHPDKRYYQ